MKKTRLTKSSASGLVISFSLALLMLFFAAYPSIRGWLFPKDIILIQGELLEIRQSIKSDWCVPFDGVYRAHIMFKLKPKDNLSELLGKGSWSIDREYHITKRGIDIPIDLIITSKSDRYSLDTSNVFPTTSIISNEWIGRMIGEIKLLRGCYQSVGTIGNISDKLKSYKAKIVMRVNKVTTKTGKTFYRVLSFTDRLVAIFYHFHLKYLFWIGFLFYIARAFYLLFRMKK
ncbi:MULTISPECIES: hypothetical protein [unclassified Marinobacter]|jgi:hypothetical protein|uniref:hypothetical protein n=1 Tax=unclassified Marinobacter TaxID=83889 RepID=UPI00200D56F2|nr:MULTISPECIES: hypothetical protein [unclassified Marinobacter]MCL1481094.1 hypothetical protein [Marinobacter sp.]UQG56054.1 hypothetical protein MIH16_22135 [Marinobacter sp. M4C]UQG64858.1 hypothetical protein MIH17_22130 [Marinobacter sp. M2C]UQG69137.1 hypothetical protein MIH19_22140 [Marinobacter sp. M1C]